MAQLLVRNIEDGVIERLKERARKYGISLEELARDILRDAATDSPRGGEPKTRRASHPSIKAQTLRTSDSGH